MGNVLGLLSRSSIDLTISVASLRALVGLGFILFIGFIRGDEG